MGKIGDLFVRLGLKSDDYSKGIKKARSETTGFGASLGKMKAGALAVWTAIGAGVTKFAQDFVAATNTIGDKWQQTMDGIKASYHSVLTDMSNYKPDFSSFRNFFKNEWAWIKGTIFNAKESGEAAKEMTKAFDAEFELLNSVRLQKTQISGELNDLYVKMRDTTLDPAARKAAANRYRSLLQPLADAEIGVYRNMLDEAVKQWQAGSGGMLSRQYSTAELTDFFSTYGTDPAAAASKYGELANVYENRKGDAQNQVLFDTMTKLAAAEHQMSETNRVLSRTELSIDKQLADLAAQPGLMLQQAVDEVMESIEEDVAVIEDLDIEVPQIDLDNFDAAEQQLKQFVDTWKAEQEEIAYLNDMLEDSFIQAASGSLQALTDMMFGIDGADASDVLAALLEPFANTATQLGEMLIAEGVGIMAFKESLKSLNPYVAIGAGVALVALGAALKSGIQALGNGGTAASSYDASSYSAGNTASSVQNYESELVVTVQGKLSGSDIVLSGTKTQNKWGR